VIGIAGPRQRLTAQRMAELRPALLAAASELAALRGGSALLARPPLGKA
jgi:IclR family transcriptional regulator, acetate operon repressor